jgi:hypothetical protein
MDTIISAIKSFFNAISYRFGETTAIVIFISIIVILFLMFFSFTRKK